MFTYQKTNRYFAQISEDLEALGKKEIAGLGGKNIKAVFRGIYFDADRETLYKIIYSSRFCSRILAQLLRFDCHSAKYLYKTAKKLNWPTLIPKDGSFAVKAATSHSKIKHSHYAALCVKDAIVDQFREQFGSRPDIEKKDPDLFINLHVENNRATLSVDLSGGSLHRRGYRLEGGDAPMRETLAAAIISLTDWDGEQPLHDPMCGSGTLLAEALMHYCRIPAAYLRKRFGVELLPDFDPGLWEKMKSTEQDKIRTIKKGLISGSDISPTIIAGARKNLATLPGGTRVELKASSFKELKNLNKRVIVCNPPYGIRLQASKPISKFMNSFGDFLKHTCRQSTAYLYFGNSELASHIRLRHEWKKPLINGGLKGVLVKYSLS